MKAMTKATFKPLLESCTQATTLANTISVRMLEYLSSVKHQPRDFGQLAAEFVETCRILQPIELGLVKGVPTNAQYPIDLLEEFDRKLRQTIHNFKSLNHMLTKFVEYERTSSLGRLQKGFRMMFADSEVSKIRQSLATTKTTLKMSALAFRWVLEELESEQSLGIGITGLIAALESMHMPTTTIPQHPPSTKMPEVQRPPTPTSLSATNSSSSVVQDAETALETKPAPTEHHTPQFTSSSRFAQSPISSKRHTHTTLRDITPISSADTRVETLDDRLFHTTIGSLQFQDRGQEPEDEKLSSPTYHLKSDTKAVPRRTPKHNIGAHSSELKTSLVNAVRSKNHKLLEELLDDGVLPDSVSETNVLIEAVHNRDPATVRLLLLFGTDPNGFGKNEVTPLLLATDLCFTEGARILLRYGADPNLCTGPDEESPLAMSVADHRFELAQLYLQCGGDANLIMPSGNTPMIKAINKTTPAKLIELLLTHNADPNGKNAKGQTPLFMAISAERVDLMTILLDHSANPNLPGPKHPLWPSTPQPEALSLLLSRGADHRKCPGIMELATSMNNIESVKTMLLAGVDPNTKKDGVYTPLCSAIRDDRGDIISILLAHGADPNLPASEYPGFKCVSHKRMHLLPTLVAAGTDLHRPKGILETAVKHNNKDALLYLLDQGVSPNDRVHDTGYTPLTTAIRDGRGELVDILLSRGADPTVRGQDWPLSMAVKHGQDQLLKKMLNANPSGARSVRGLVEMAVGVNSLACIKLLLGAGVSVEDKTGGVFSPLTTAIREDRKEIVKFLLDEAGANVNAPGEHLPLVKALRRCHKGSDNTDTDIIEMLLARGADINLMYRGWNPVLQALENGDMRVLKLLLEKSQCGGVDLQRQDEEGRTVAEVIREMAWEDGVELLLADEGKR